MNPINDKIVEGKLKNELFRLIKENFVPRETG